MIVGAMRRVVFFIADETGVEYLKLLEMVPQVPVSEVMRWPALKTLKRVRFDFSSPAVAKVSIGKDNEKDHTAGDQPFRASSDQRSPLGFEEQMEAG